VNPLKIAVNLSPVQFQRTDLPEVVQSILLETGLPATRLELEITESVIINDMSRALSLLRRLKNLGIGIAMDDFGTGYSSLATLQAFPFDKIKIDRSFVSKLESQPQAAAIMRAVLALGRSLGIGVVAEGVENNAQLRFLNDEACAEVQGYLFGRPQPIERFASEIYLQTSASDSTRVANSG
jgi:diguanylate cyclase